ncbi:MAG TPA: PQQ-dependent dehydrogenase, methanol/ethanol family [Bryobacteraceae bacterium]|nr:PQQ-dependent dehydrogenase, methanol/ethanol family [Bryobacteraceae bacterium]
MKPNRPILFLLVISIGALTTTSCTARAVAAGTPSYDVAGMKPGIHLVSPLPTGDWALATGDYANTRFSPLDKINTGNVHDLHLVGTHNDGIPHGWEGGPLFVNKTLYITEPFPNQLVAFELANVGITKKWVYSPNPSNRAVGIACCDVVNRGASYADGKIVYNILDDHTVAVDANTGKEVWRTAVGDPNLGETETMAPQIVKNIVYVGISGGELGVRGRLTALDLKTGKILWRAYNTGPDADCLIGPGFKPFYKSDQGKDLGVTTWGPDEWRRGGAPVWGWISYDPGLNMIYYGTGNAGPWDADDLPAQSKWAMTIWARDATTGEAKWAWQAVPQPGWDYDQVAENVLLDIEWQGRLRKVLVNAGKTGYVVLMDRETGELLSAEPFQPVTWSTGYDLKTGLPSLALDKETHRGKMITGICPANLGAKNFEPTAFSPRTGFLYIPARNICMDKQDARVNYIAGTPYIGAKLLNIPGPGNYQGELIAWDVVHAKKAWGIKEAELGLDSGVLATAGDVVFYGTMDNYFKAVDARDGKLLWETRLGSGVISNPMTFLGPDGKQYIGVYAGIGGALGAPALKGISAKDPYAALGAVGAEPNLKNKTGPGGAFYVFGY